MTPRVRDPNAKFSLVPGEPFLQVHKESGVYYVRIYKQGHGRIFKSLRTKKITVAREAALDAIKEWLGTAPGLRAKKKRLADLCEMLFQELKEAHENLDEEGHPERSASTFEKDRIFLHDEEIRRGKKDPVLRRGKVKEYFGRHYPEEIDENFWEAWWKKTGRKHFNKSAELAKYLSHVLDYAYRNKYLGRKPTIRSFDRHKKTAVAYSPDQVLTFHENAEPMLQDLIIINSENPFRPLETPLLQWTMVEIKEQKVKAAKKKPSEELELVVTVNIPAWLEKTRDGRSIQVSPNAAKVFQRRFQERNPSSPYVFPSPASLMKPLSRKTLNRMWHRMLKDAGLEESGFQFKWLRHTVYTELLIERGLPLAQVSAVGGTSMATLSKHYLVGDARRTAAVGKAISRNFSEEEE